MTFVKKISTGFAAGMLALSVTGGMATPGYALENTSQPAATDSNISSDSYLLTVEKNDEKSVTFTYQLGDNVSVEENENGKLGFRAGDKFEELPEVVKTDSGAAITGKWVHAEGKLTFVMNEGVNIPEVPSNSDSAGASIAAGYSPEYASCIMNTAAGAAVAGGVGGLITGPGAMVGFMGGAVGGFLGAHISCR